MGSNNFKVVHEVKNIQERFIPPTAKSQVSPKAALQPAGSTCPVRAAYSRDRLVPQGQSSLRLNGVGTPPNLGNRFPERPKPGQAGAARGLPAGWGQAARYPPPPPTRSSGRSGGPRGSCPHKGGSGARTRFFSTLRKRNLGRWRPKALTDPQLPAYPTQGGIPTTSIVRPPDRARGKPGHFGTCTPHSPTRSPNSWPMPYLKATIEEL